MGAIRLRVRLSLATLGLAMLPPAWAGPAGGGTVVAYELKGRIVVKEGARTVFCTQGSSPSLSPSGTRVAFLRGGAVCIANLRGGQVWKLTRPDPETQRETFFPVRPSWSPSERTLAYTRALPFRLASGGRALKAATRRQRHRSDLIWVRTIWLLDIKSRRTTELVGPMGNIRAMARTDQLEGASVYEPIFSPDGRWVWFLNAGSLYEIRVHPVRAARRSAARLVAKIGFLDLGSTGLSKAGMGAREMAWDPVHKRLWYRIGRFWGESVSWLGYITRRAGKWGTPTDSWPSFAAEIESAWPNIQDCAVDHRGLLWVWYYSTPHGHWVWASYDGTRSLAPGAGRPSFCRAIARPAPQVIRSRRART